MFGRLRFLYYFYIKIAIELFNNLKIITMKTMTNLTVSELMNFDKEVVNYINDNLQYIKENAAACENDDLAKESLEHYNESVDAAGDTEEYLSEEQKERFYEVAKRLFNQGFVEHSGILND